MQNSQIKFLPRPLSRNKPVSSRSKPVLITGSNTVFSKLTFGPALPHRKSSTIVSYLMTFLKYSNPPITYIKANAQRDQASCPRPTKGDRTEGTPKLRTSPSFPPPSSQPHVLQMPFSVLPGFTASLHLNDTSQGTFISSVSVTLT